MTLRALPCAPEPIDDVLEITAKLSRLAKTGELRGLVVAFVCQLPGDPACSAEGHAGELRMGPMVVALERAKLRLLGFVEAQHVQEESP